MKGNSMMPTRQGKIKQGGSEKGRSDLTGAYIDVTMSNSK
jgi:hypothetical protein